MSALIFLGGAGIGSLLAVLLFMLATSGISKEHIEKAEKSRADAKEAHNRTLELLSERNDIGSNQAVALNRIADELEFIRKHNR